ncbi:MAG: outer membrane lipoprotein chaperone LolA [Gammaproteobacteria bacterium]|nr:outer membrane lipoprotein chaperone LolA [Gammaproteobacteria bacterium]
MSLIKKIVSLSLIAGLFGNAYAGEGLERLKQYQNGLRTLSAEFTQTVFDQDAKQLDVASGKLALQKPGKFRWEYTQPYQQLIVADGKKLWIYDADLAQVTVKDMSSGLGAAPIALLTSEVPLEQEFTVIELGLIDGRQMLQLEVKNKDTDFGFMLLALGKNGLEVMELKDKLGQVTRIELRKSIVNAAIDDKQFMFTPPKGTDILSDEPEQKAKTTDTAKPAAKSKNANKAK